MSNFAGVIGPWVSTDLLSRWLRTIVRNASNIKISNENQAEIFYSQEPNKEIQSIRDISKDVEFIVPSTKKRPFWGPKL